MTQEKIYAKDISREINGVIKASSRADLATEIKEYIITAEQMRLLPSLFSKLKRGDKLPFVWISGDFGSGKSHLLKILSYVLENQERVDGQTFGQIFADKAADDFEFAGDIDAACRMPNQSVLFNIQESLDGVGKQGIDPVLNIFLKEFNRKLGFDEKKPAIAEIERYFERAGRLQWLKDEYRSRFGKEWEVDRPSILLKQQNIAAILADLDGTTKEVALQNVKTQIDKYTLDTDGFVKLVNEYLGKQAPGTRLIFFVDEVGQFIGKDVDRMLSLQTIAEGLGDKTDGRATIMVTSQMDLDAALGNLKQDQQHDFSRIQGRFTTRISLTSANADEVIQRRLLEKTPEAEAQLRATYEDQRNIIKTLFNFGDNSQFKTKYKDAHQYAIDFPFVDYQFDLLQHSIIELSKNNAFTGKQQSVGERSMLTITQDVAKLYKDKGLGDLVQFCDMYEGLRSILQAKIQSDILLAESTLADDMALRVLKALFLVKYVKGFPSTLDNITRLLLPALDTDFIEYRSQVQEALNKLVRMSYIEKAANDEYHYQTNEEKDIENEIKNEQLSPDAINGELKKIFRDEIFFESKIKLTSSKIFPYGRYVDDQQDGRESELYINFVTPLTGLSSTEHEAMTAYSLQHPNHLCVVLGEDKYLAEDISMYKKAEKCLTRLLSSAGDYRQQIVTDKRRINSRRRENIVQRLTDLTKDARLYIFGSEVDVRYSDIKTRLSEAMKRLVEMVYINLRMLDIEYDQSMLKRIIASTDNNDLPHGEEMDECSADVYNKIVRDKNLSIRNTVKSLVDYFRGNQYGWYETATLCILAKLSKLGKISFRMNGTAVDDRNLFNALTNSQQQQQAIVDVEETITNAQIAKLKKIYKDFFDGENCTAQGAKEVHKAFKERLAKEYNDLRLILDSNRDSRRQPLAFAHPLQEIVTEIKKYADMPYPGLYTAMDKLDAMIDDIEDKVVPIRDFVGSNQYGIYDKVVRLVSGNNANLAYVDQPLRDILDEAYASAEPWQLMNRAKQAMDDITAQITEKQSQTRQEVSAHIDAKLESLTSLPAWPSLKDNQRSQITAMIEVQRNGIATERYIGNLMAKKPLIDKLYDNAIDIINRWIEEVQNNQGGSGQSSSGQGTGNNGSSNQGVGSSSTGAGSSSGSGTSSGSGQHNIRKSVNKKKAMKVEFNKPYLENRQDVEDYISALRTQLLDYINRNTNVLLQD